MKTKAVLLDAGLTLLRASPSLGGVYSRVARRHGVDADPEGFGRAAEAAFHFMGIEHREGGTVGLRTSDEIEHGSWRRHARRVMDGMPEMAGVDFERWFEDLYGEFGAAVAWEPFDDAVPAIEALRERGVRLAVVSNWDSRLRNILRARRLEPYFDAVVISAEVGWRKPHGAIFRRSLEALGAAPGEALHVGDSVGDDVEGARAAGIRPVLLDRSGEKRVDGADVIRDLRQIVDLLGE
jgi:putative hydrolase of the HAD superfamily